MTTTLLIIQFTLTVLITIVILLQKSSSIGLGAYSGSNESMFGSKGPTNFLQKATYTLGLLFVLNTLTLGYFYNQETSKSAIDKVNIESLIPSAPQENIAPTAPTSTSEVPQSIE
ncbi:MAG: preprotein translocase subunit SecG [Arcobacter butzleri]|jgi:preprotein translocase subunit SecG|nr:preprotein translocase subunit SecG [Arcobacteraceae bacterium]MDY0365274.1 preprotein translocase subunit SecG [Arcobacteraceae bacterium]NLO17305.1 preprotein translocase subunit SecG [Aliarcobacter butzleri]